MARVTITRPQASGPPHDSACVCDTPASSVHVRDWELQMLQTRACLFIRAGRYSNARNPRGLGPHLTFARTSGNNRLSTPERGECRSAPPPLKSVSLPSGPFQSFHVARLSESCPYPNDAE